MSKITVFLFLLLATVAGYAQSARNTTAQVKTYAVLPDHGYTLDKVRTDTTLKFITNDSLRLDKGSIFWLRVVVVNPSRYDEPYNLSFYPALNNTIYGYDANSQRWMAQQTGVYAPNGRRLRSRYRAAAPFMALKQAETSLYIKADLRVVHQIKAIKPQIFVENQAITGSNEEFMRVTWVATLLVLCLFFLNNLFIYFNFKDKIVLYYLIVQIGGMINLTYYKQFIYSLIPSPVFTVEVSATGDMYCFDLASVLQHFSILLILYGIVQSTRAYLNTSVTLPRLDLIIKYGLYAYILVSVVLVAINTWLVYLETYTLTYHNILALIVIGSVICTCVVGYVRKLPAAAPFLLANILPLVFMLAIVLFHIFISVSPSERLILPDLAIISQTLSFSIALVARTKFIQKELITKRVEAQKLEFNIREIELRHRLTELENQKINADIRHEKTRNELLQERLDVNQRELASTTLYLVQKNEMLAGLKAQLLKLNKQYPNVRQQGLKSIESLLQSNLYLDADWGKFKVHFEQVHPDFFENLQAKHPNLTKYEIRLFAYFHINLSTKEIAALLNIDPASVRRAKTRLYKKMAIPEPDVLANPRD